MTSNTMEATNEQHQATFQEERTERSPSLSCLTINQLPDEVLLEIFDCYRQDINSYDYQWGEKHVWINLVHVCSKWRAVVFASYVRLDLGVLVGPKKPGHIKTILSGPLPISIDYQHIYEPITGSALWRMRATLKRHPDRVRKITFQGKRANFDKFFELTNRAFPVLDTLSLHFCGPYVKIPDTFLRGPDLSDLHLLHLELTGVSRVSLPPISEFLLSATALTDLVLHFDNSHQSPLSETSLLACLKGLSCLRSLDLGFISGPVTSSQPSTPKDIVTLSKLTFFRYIGHDILFFDALVAGLSAPSLRDVEVQYCAGIWPPMVVHIPRFINEIEEHYHVVHVVFQAWLFHLSLLPQSGYISHCKPGFKFGTISLLPSESIMRMSGVLSTTLATVEELHLSFDKASTDVWEDLIPWRRSWRKFLQQFPSVKVLRTEDKNNCFARILLQGYKEPDDDVTFLPALEEIELDKNSSSINESQCRPRLVAFEPFVSARRKAGRPVKVFFSK